MTYRFMVEVPEYLQKAAELQIGALPDTQIVVSRLSFASGYDHPYAALTLASENLRPIEAIDAWFRELPPPRVDVRVVLNSGQRLSFLDHSSSEIIAAIRADQPWVEHAIPRIGDHVVDQPAGGGTAVATRPEAEVATERRVQIDHVNFIAINVMDLRRAERFYREFLDLEVIGRTVDEANGSQRMLPEDYDWEAALAAEALADHSYMRNGELVIALHRVGVGARLDRNILDRISIQVDGASYRRLKAAALVSSYEFLAETEMSFVIRDPFGVPWEIGLAGHLPHALRAALRS